MILVGVPGFLPEMRAYCYSGLFPIFLLRVPKLFPGDFFPDDDILILINYLF